MIRGLGFTWEVTPYWDATSMISSWGYDIMKKKYDYLKFVKDTISFTPITETKDVKSFEFTIKDSNNQVVYTAPSSTKLPVKFVWDGKNNEKLPAPDGFYSAALHVVATISYSFERPTFPLSSVAVR